MLGISKVLMITCTYDHRIIQGAESGSFLGKLQQLLRARKNFYDQIFRDLKIPIFRSVAVRSANQPHSADSALNADVAKEAAVIQLINSYRVRGHLIANTNPLGNEPVYHPEFDPSSYGLSIWDLDRPFLAGAVKAPQRRDRIVHAGRMRRCAKSLTACGIHTARSIGVEYMHIQDPVQKQWLQDRMEATMNLWPLDESVRKFAR